MITARKVEQGYHFRCFSILCHWIKDKTHFFNSESKSTRDASSPEIIFDRKLFDYQLHLIPDALVLKDSARKVKR